MELEEEWSLILLAQGVDKDSARTAFAEIYRRHAGTVYVTVLSRVRNVHLAQDLTSQTFLNAWRRIDSVTYLDTGICAWLVTIAKNVSLDYLKPNRRHQREVPIEDLSELFDSRHSAVSAEGEALARIVAAEVRRGVAQLDGDQRLCIDLRFLQDRPRSEVAAELQRSETAVSQLQCRAMKKLGKILEAA